MPDFILKQNIISSGGQVADVKKSIVVYDSFEAAIAMMGKEFENNPIAARMDIVKHLQGLRSITIYNRCQTILLQLTLAAK